jgi:hypothetical protein
MVIQHTQQDLTLYHIGLYGLYNLGLEEQEDTTGIYNPKVIRSKQAYEDFKFTGGVGYVPIREEGEEIEMDDIPKRFTFRVTPVIHSMGLGRTTQAAYKDVYGFIAKQANDLAEATQITKNLMACDTYMNKAFPGGTSLGPDGKTLFASDHTTVGTDTQSNYGTSTLGPTALETAIQAIRDQRTDRDLMPANITGKFKLVTGPLLNAQAYRVVKSIQIAGSNANDTNAWITGNIGSIEVDPHVNYGMTTMAQAWALFTMNPKWMKNIELFIQPYRTVMDDLKKIDSTATYVHFENLYSHLGWKGTYGNKP